MASASLTRIPTDTIGGRIRTTRKAPKRSGGMPGLGMRLMASLDEHCVLMLSGAELLLDSHQQQRPEEFDLLVSSITGMEQSLQERLERAWLCPLDADDFRALSAGFRRILQRQARAAEKFVHLPAEDWENAGRSLQGSLRCAELLTQAVAVAPSKAKVLAETQALQRAIRAAEFEVRTWSVSAIERVNPHQVMSLRYLLAGLRELFGQYRDTTRILERAVLRVG